MLSSKLACLLAFAVLTCEELWLTSLQILCGGLVMRRTQMCSNICGHHMSNSIFTSCYIIFIYDMVCQFKKLPKNVIHAVPTPSNAVRWNEWFAHMLALLQPLSWHVHAWSYQSVLSELSVKSLLDFMINQNFGSATSNPCHGPQPLACFAAELCREGVEGGSLALLSSLVKHLSSRPRSVDNVSAAKLITDIC